MRVPAVLVVVAMFALPTQTAGRSVEGLSRIAAASGSTASGRLTSEVGSDQDWLGEINAYREGSGLSPVADQPTWDAGIQDHLTYLADTPPSLLTGQYADLHDENPASPYYTAAGAHEGASSDLYPCCAFFTPVQYIDGWLAAPFHAVGMLRPDLTQVAFADDPTTGSAGLDVISGFDYSLPPATSPVLFPGPGMTTDLKTFGGESPDPLQTCGWSGTAGLPLIALLPQAPVSGLTAQLTGPTGAETSTGGTLCVVDEHTYYTTDSIYGPVGLQILQGDNVVVLIPRHPLADGSYQTTINQPGQPAITWSFTEVDSAAALTIAAVSPNSGSVIGGQPVTITGSSFEDGATVTFGRSQATRVQFVSRTQLTAVTPPGTGTVGVTVSNPDGGSVSDPSAYSYVPGGGYTLDAFGGVHAFGDSPPVTITGYWPGWSIAKSSAMDPCDTSGQYSGWVMDGFGGLHPFAAAGTPMPAVPDITGYWPGWTIANDVAAFCITVGGVQHAAGCVLDGFGGLHPWADSSAVIGDVPCTGTGYWPNWDIATKIAVVPGHDYGYVMDGFGGIHPFNGAPYYAPSGYWPGWTIARGIVATATGGYTVDGFGGIHPFGNAPVITPSGYWPNWDIVRGIAVAWTGGGNTGVYTLDGFGGIHAAGGAAFFEPSGYWPNWDITVDLVSAP
jgi:hypothetical protein